jgi:hypothetical protein
VLVPEPSPDGIKRFLPGDIDGDGDPDIALHSGQNFDDLGWCENEGGSATLPCHGLRFFMDNPHPAMFVGKLSQPLDPIQDTIAFWEDFGSADFWLCYDHPTLGMCGLTTDLEHAAIFDSISQASVARLTPFGAAPEQLLYFYEPNGFDVFGWSTSPFAPDNAPLFSRPAASGLLLRTPFAADMDDDGNDDVILQNVITGGNINSISWLEITDLGNTPPTQIAEHPVWQFPDGISQEFFPSRVISAGDLNDDGDTDLVVFRRFTFQSALPERLIWLESDGALPPSFVEHEIATSSSEVQIRTGDLDGDGDEDVIVMTDHMGPTLVQFGWYENLDGEGTQWGPLTTLVDASSSLVIDDAEVAHRFHVLDFDGDDDLDLLDAGSAIGSANAPRGVRLIENLPEPEGAWQIITALGLVGGLVRLRRRGPRRTRRPGAAAGGGTGPSPRSRA